MRRTTAALAFSLAVPLAAEAQPAGKVWRIGYRGGSEQAAPLVEHLKAGLRYLLSGIPDEGGRKIRGPSGGQVRGKRPTTDGEREARDALLG